MTENCVNVSGELTFGHSMSQQKLLQSQISQLAADSIKLSLAKVSQCDSAGLALLIELKRFCTGLKKNMLIVDVPESVKNLAQFCELESLLE